MIKINLSFLQGAFLDFHVGLRLMQSRLRLIEFGLRGVLFRDQILGSFLGNLRELESRLRVFEITLRLENGSLENSRVNFRHQLTSLHR